MRGIRHSQESFFEARRSAHYHFTLTELLIVIAAPTTKRISACTSASTASLGQGQTDDESSDVLKTIQGRNWNNMQTGAGRPTGAGPTIPS